MSYTITGKCTKEDKACVEVCPVDCIQEGADMLYVHPDDCIDCGACVSACPNGAIFADADVPEEDKRFTEMNKDFYALSDEEFSVKYGKPK